jgi:MOSC domain-containing protein YiiM
MERVFGHDDCGVYTRVIAGEIAVDDELVVKR